MSAAENVSGGVWISPAGDMFGVPLTHIREVVEDPSRFNLSSEWLKSVFAKHGEGAGSEGNARDEIISLLVSNGWTRIRFHPGDKGFHVELPRLDRKHKEFLASWASKVLAKHPDRAAFPVTVSEPGGVDTRFALGELSLP
jgi:hypothetical protein